MNYFDPAQPQPQYYNQNNLGKNGEQIKPIKKKRSFGKIFTMQFFIATIFVMNLFIVGIILKNEFIANSANSTKYQSIISKVSKYQAINPGTQVYVEELKNVDTLRNENTVQQEIYKDARDGDFAVLIPQDKLVIYRESEDKIIYNGLTPNAKAQTIQNEQITAIRNVAINANLITSENTSVPDISLVQNAEAVKQQDPEFYRDVLEGDIITFFPSENVIFIYRPSSQAVINSGSTSLQIVR
jgi:hypothetical protein